MKIKFRITPETTMEDLTNASIPTREAKLIMKGKQEFTKAGKLITRKGSKVTFSKWNVISHIEVAD